MLKFALEGPRYAGTHLKRKIFDAPPTGLCHPGLDEDFCTSTFPVGKY